MAYDLEPFLLGTYFPQPDYNSDAIALAVRLSYR